MMDLASSVTTEGRQGGSPLMLKMVVAEYESLRGEIGRFQDHQQQILNFGFLALAAIVAGFGSALAGQKDLTLVQALRNYDLLLLIVPLVYLFLAALFAERTIRIMRVGDYLDREIRQLVKESVGTDVLRWEDHRRSPRLFAHRIVRLVSVGRLLDALRWFGFVGPIGLCLILLWVARPSLAADEWALLGLDVLALIVTCVFAMTIDESSGVRRQT